MLMSSCGDWIVTPAVVVSKTCSKEPAKRETSVEVPPMSKPMVCGERWGAAFSIIIIIIIITTTTTIIIVIIAVAGERKRPGTRWAKYLREMVCGERWGADI